MPDEVFDAISEFMDFKSGYAWGEPEFYHGIQTYVWHAQMDEDMNDD